MKFDPTSQEFIDLVGSEVRGYTTDKQSQELNADENIDILYEGLVNLKSSVEFQLTERKVRNVNTVARLQLEEADYIEIEDAVNEYLNWRMKTLKFLKYIEQHISKVKLRKTQLKNNTAYLVDLIDAINKQQESIPEEDMSEHDKRVFRAAKKIA